MPASMMAPVNVSLSTIAAHRRGSVNVIVHPEKDSSLLPVVFGCWHTRLLWPAEAISTVRQGPWNLPMKSSTKERRSRSRIYGPQAPEERGG